MRKIILVMFLVLLCGCCPEYNHRFSCGDTVKMRLDGAVGMVVSRSMYHDAVTVRFSADSTGGHVGILGGSVSESRKPYSTITVHEWELEQTP